MKTLMNKPTHFFLIFQLLLMSTANIYAQSESLRTYNPPIGYVLDWQTDWRAMEPGLKGNDALPEPWYVETGENRASKYVAPNVFTTSTDWGTALALQASATGNDNADRYGGKIKTPKFYVKPPFVMAVWATINPVHGKKNSLWTMGDEGSETPDNKRGFFEIDLTEIGYAQRGKRIDGNTAYSLPPGHGWCAPNVHLWEWSKNGDRDQAKMNISPENTPDALHTVEALQQPLLFVTQISETDVRIWQEGKLVFSIKASDLSGSSKNTDRPWTEIFKRALRAYQQIIFSSEAIKDGMAWSASYGNKYYGTGPFDDILFPSSTYIHMVKVYKKSDISGH